MNQSNPLKQTINKEPDNQLSKPKKNPKKKGFFHSLLFRIIKWFLGTLLTLILLGAIVGGLAYLYYEKDLPDVKALSNVKLQAPLQILTKEGALIAVFGEKRRDPLTYEEIPQIVIDAVVATEDSRFYEHYGIDPIGILRAVAVGIANKGKFSQGGSTITQQVAKNYFLSADKKIERKAKEAILALRMEKELSKNEIITIYLNMIYFGARSYGVSAAAHTFFNKNVQDLTLSEVALLAGLPNAPSAYNPIYHKEKALARRNWVLHRMLDQNFITEEQYQEAIQEPIDANYYSSSAVEFSAPYVAEMVRQFMVNRYGDSAYDDGYKVYTTISKKEQTAATEALVSNLVEYDKEQGYRGPEQVLWRGSKAALSSSEIAKKLTSEMCFHNLCPAVVIESSKSLAKVVMKSGEELTLNLDQINWAKIKEEPVTKVSDLLVPGQLIRITQVDINGQKEWQLAQLPLVEGSFIALNDETGAIDALVGGFDFNRSKFNRVTQAIRQIGSTIKPFIYASTLENGLTLGSIINDTPITRTAGTGMWRPKNYPEVYSGPLRLRVGLISSKNVMMVRSMRTIGVEKAADYLLNFGFPKENISYNESLALGAAAFTPLQVARAYSVIANGGYLITPYLIDKIKQSEETVYEYKPQVACLDCMQTQYNRAKEQYEFRDAEEVNQIDDNEVPDEDKLQSSENLLLIDNTSAQDIYAQRVINQDVAFLIKDAMHSVVYGEKGVAGTAWRSRIVKRQDMGGKTGTTNDSKDAWFAGYVGNRVAVAWMGYDDHRYSLNDASGGKTASPIWNDYMQAVKGNIPVVETRIPKDIIKVNIDRKTGLLSADKENAVSEYYIKGTEPTTYQKTSISQSIVNEQGENESIF